MTAAMLSIGAMGHGQGDYYVGLAREDYYLEGGEPPGTWGGAGAAALGLHGAVRADEFQNLLLGFGPDGTVPLIQNAGDQRHQPGWDLTFSAPKSVSVLWSQSDVAVRQAIQMAHATAVRAAMGYLEQQAALTRRGRAGEVSQHAGLVTALFEHGTSRAQDPQIHTHALVINVGVRGDRSTGTIVSKPLYEHKMTAGALYRAELAAQLAATLNIVVERHGASFQIRDVPSSLVDEFSKRRHEILNALAALGLYSAQAAAIAARDTRTAKVHLPREELFRLWHEVGAAHGVEGYGAAIVRSQPSLHENATDMGPEIVRGCVERMMVQRNFFAARDLVRSVAEEAQGVGIPAAEVLRLVQEHLDASPEIVRIGDGRRSVLFTTRQMVELERSLLSLVDSSRMSEAHVLDKNTVAAVVSRLDTIRPEQVRALEDITCRPGAIQAVAGMAGTGKTFLLAAARDAWEREGYRVHGAALAGKAAQGLQEGAGIPSDTIHARLRDLKSGRLHLDTRTVLVVDEAGMVGTRQMADIVAAVIERGAKLVLVGDAKQLQPIEAGGPFGAIGRRVHQAELTEITRQRSPWAREAVHQFARGGAFEALLAYAEHGLLTIGEDRTSARCALIEAWRQGGIEAPQQHLIIANTRVEAGLLNEMAQNELRRAGRLAAPVARFRDGRAYVGDRILFTRNSRLYGVKNGSLGTVIAGSDEDQWIRVELDDGTRTTIDLRHYSDVRLGYAITTHKGQGITAANVYVMVGGAMQDREISYVQASRAQYVTRMFVDRTQVPDDLSQLARQMSESHQKDLVTDMMPEQVTGIGPALG